MTTRQPADLPRLTLQEEEPQLSQLFLDVQHILIKNPQAARTILQAFIAEGRRFAETEEGQVWQDVLSRSELAKRSRLLWDAYSLDALVDVETDTKLLPQTWLDVLTAAVSSPDLETILSTLVVEGMQNGNVSPAS